MAKKPLTQQQQTRTRRAPAKKDQPEFSPQDDVNVKPVEVSTADVLAMKSVMAHHHVNTKEKLRAIQMHAPFQVTTSMSRTLEGGRSGDWILVDDETDQILGVVPLTLFEQSYVVKGGKK